MLPVNLSLLDCLMAGPFGKDGLPDDNDSGSVTIDGFLSKIRDLLAPWVSGSW